MNALKLRIVLLVGLVVVLGALGVGAWWLQGMLAAQVAKTEHARIDAEIAQIELDKLRGLRSQLEEQKDIVERAAQIAATADNYQYQDQVVKDLETYARRHNISIASFDFSGASAPGASANSPAGTTRTPFSVSLVGPVSFNSFMNFLHDIENNLTKLQVSSLSLTPTADNPQLVSNPNISLVVYLKK